MSEYQKSESANVPRRNCFNGDTFGGKFRGIYRKFVLADWKNNFYQPILEEVFAYFKHNGISWWGGRRPTGHVLSSQIACLNHLFAIRNDKNAVFAVAKTICNEIEEVLPVPIDNYLPAFIAFEAVSDNDLLKEGIPTRGSQCTSIDALMLAKDKNGKIVLIPIEWKYTEFYHNTDKSIEDGERHEKGSKTSGIVRLNRYSDLIHKSTQLEWKYEDYKSKIYFFEPFYQFMRQTLWAEQMIKYKQNERIKADYFIQVCVIPNENHDLLKDDLEMKGYSNREIPERFDNLEKTWKSCLKDENKYKIISPESLLQNIDNQKLKEYLSIRYWNK